MPDRNDFAAGLPLRVRVCIRVRRKNGRTVFGGPEFTVSPVYEGMLKEEMDAAATRHPHVPYDPQLIDATYALLLSTAGDRRWSFRRSIETATVFPIW